MEGPEHREGETAVAVGDVVAGRYRVLAPMGAGGMATVHRAEDVQTGRRVALKVLRPDVGRSPEAAERLRREAEILAHLRHPAIVGIERSGTLPNGQFYLCMELLEGETLGDRMRRGRMNVDALAPIVAGATAGLAAAHDLGVVHRDLKPDNVFLAQGAFGAPMQVKLLDFGISKVVGFDKITRTGQVLGTPRYMAPEQLTAERDLDGRVDVYALGVILYEALAGQPPFPATEPSALIVSILSGSVVPLRSLRPDLPAEVEALVARAMARAREARHASAAELGVAFAEVARAFASRAARAPEGEASAGPRAQMRTSALGAMSGGSVPPPPNAPLPPAQPEPFKPSTFSEFAAVPAPPREPVAPTPVGMTAADAKGEASLPVAAPRAEPTVPAPAPAAPAPARTSRARFLYGALAGLFLAALLVGVLGYLALDGRFHLVEAPEPPSPTGLAPPPPPVPDIVVGAAAPTASPALAAPVAPAAPAPVPSVGAEVVPAAAVTPAPLPTGVEPPARAPAQARSVRPSGSADAPRRERRAGSGPAAPAEEQVPPPFVYQAAPAAAAPEADDEPSASALLRAARERQRAGDPDGCIELAERAVGAGAGATAQLLLGDCHLAAGDTERAGKAYERFCRAMPDHPAVLRVMAVVERTGGRCD